MPSPNQVRPQQAAAQKLPVEKPIAVEEKKADTAVLIKPEDIAAIVAKAVAEALGNAPNKEEPKESTNIVKRVARHIVGDAPIKKYLAVEKNAMLMIEDQHVIQFANFMFETNVDLYIEFLDNCGLVGTKIFKDTYPENVLDKFKRDRELLSKEKFEVDYKNQ